MIAPTTTSTLTRAEMVAKLKKIDPNFVEGASYTDADIEQRYSAAIAAQPVKLDSRLSPVTISQIRAKREELSRRFDGDPERQKEELARFDATAVERAYTYDERAAERARQLTEDVRLDQEGPGADLSPVTRAKIEYVRKIDEFARRGQGGGFNGGGSDAA